jgi:hypothetical protein
MASAIAHQRINIVGDRLPIERFTHEPAAEPVGKREYADLIEQVDVAGLSIEEVAAKSGITPNNAYVRLHRARKALRERLESACGKCATGGGRCGDCYCQEV